MYLLQRGLMGLLSLRDQKVGVEPKTMKGDTWHKGGTPQVRNEAGFPHGKQRANGIESLWFQCMTLGVPPPPPLSII